MPNIQLVGRVSTNASEALRNSLLKSRNMFSFYRTTFDRLGISHDDILNSDPLDVLRQLPLLTEDTLHELTEESLRVADRIIDVETSSGTTGPRKRRFISYADDVSDHEVLAEMFALCGIGPSDRVACLDVDPVNLMVSFTKALDLLGAEEAYAFCVAPEPDRPIDSLARLNPSVIVSAPSIIRRSLEQLRRHIAEPGSRLSKLVCFGEPLPHHLRSTLESGLGVEVFVYYGATETSSLGIECSAHDGVHLLTDRNVIEIETRDPAGLRGQIVVTTLKQQTLPLLRYALKDEIAVKAGECQCGLSYPRVEVTGRSIEGFSVLGVTVSYSAIENCVYQHADGPNLIELVLTRTVRDKLTIVVPESLRGRENRIGESLLTGKHDVGFLIGSRYLDLEFSFVPESYFKASRKRRSIVDLRGRSDDRPTTPQPEAVTQRA